MSGIYLLNLTSVGVFGMVLSAAFCDICWTRKKAFAAAGSMAAILLLQAMIYFFIDTNLVTYVYPLITHFPLAVVLCALSGKCLWSVVSVLTAYLCCQLRRWLALLIVAIFSGGTAMQNVTELAMTLPILFILLRFAAPSVRAVSHYARSVQCQFGLVPALYYGFDYLTRIYTDLLLEGVLVAVEFMPFVCSVAYLIFVVYTSKEWKIRSQLEQTQDILNLQVEQAVREIEALRESQEKISAYRHDLRHHMQFLLACMENDRIGQAQAYIRQICSEIEANKVTVFCENETVNLIFSAFAGRAKKLGVLIKVKAVVSRTIPVSESDLCVLLSNALENALHSCLDMKQKGLDGTIEVSVYEKKGKMFLQVINSCDRDIVFDSGMPVTDRPGHGIGVRSICTIVEQYGGVCSFLAENGWFILRISL